MFGLWMLKLNDRFSNFFDNKGNLSHCHWDCDKNLKTFKDLFTILNQSNLESHVLRNNINIMNSPLRSFSIKRKNESILSLKNEDY